jgi:SAM-dependent methyltransferase
MALVTERKTCRLCGGVHLTLVLSLGASPLGDDFVDVDDLKKPQPNFPVDLMLCADCGQVQLSQVVNPDAIYKHYSYLTSFSRGLVTHFEAYADAIFNKYPFPKDALCVEIGSNEGAMLRSFRQRGMRVLGIDPAPQIAARATADGLETWPEYFSETTARRILARHGKAHLVVANNVLANIDDLDDIVRGIKLMLAPGGVFCFETSYLLPVVKNNLLDTIFHEHVSYFSVQPLRAFFTRHGLELVSTQHTDPKGGSLLGVVQRAGGPHRLEDSVEAMARLEEVTGLGSLPAYLALDRRLKKLKCELRIILDDAQRKGKTIAAWGAADGPTTMIYYFQLRPYLRYILDDNPCKQSTFSPGWHLPVLSPAKTLNCASMRPDYIVLLAWRYAQRITQAYPGFSKGGGKWITPLPKVEVLP